MTTDRSTPRVATVADAEAVGRLLHDFNHEFDTPSPGADVLVSRLKVLLAGEGTFAIVAGEPPAGVAFVTLRTNIWYTGQVASLDEMYVAPHLRGQGIGSDIIDVMVTTCRARKIDLIEINVDEGDVDAQRFYERHHFSSIEPTTGERAFYFFQELSGEAG